MIPMIQPVNPRVQEFLTLLQDPEVYDVFKTLVLQALTDPEGCQLVRRVANIEKHLGADDDYCICEDPFNDDREVMLTIPEQLSLLSERINDASLPVLKETIFSGNGTEVRARFLKEKLQEVDYRNGKKFLNSKEVQGFLLREVPEEHRTTDKAARKVANDVMKRAVELFPESMILIKNKKGLNVIELIEKR